MRSLGWTFVGLGVVGLAVGTGSGIVVLVEKDDLDNECVEARCPAIVDDDRKTYNTLRDVSSIGFIAGAASVTIGTVLLIAAPAKTYPVAKVEPYVGFGTAGVRGVF